MGVYLFVAILVFLSVVYLQYKNLKQSSEAEEDIRLGLKEVDGMMESGWEREAAMDQFDRSVSSPLDDIRRFSNAALVIGIGGTMGIFLVEAVSLSRLIDNFSDDLAGKIIVGTIPALLSSLLGVGFHLYITLGILHRAQKKVINKERELLAKVDTGSRKAPPPIVWPKDVENFTEFVGAIQSVLNQQHSFLSLLNARLGREESITQKVLENQNALKEHQSEILNILVQLRKSDFFETLNNLLENIKKHSEVQQASAEKIDKRVESLANKIEDLPDGIEAKIDGNVRWLLQSLDTDLEKYLVNLSEKLRLDKLDQRKFLTDKSNEIVVNILNNIETKISDNLQKPVEEVAHDLKKIADNLKQITDEMPGVVQEYTEHLIDSTKALSVIPKKLEDAAESINEVVVSTTSESLGPISGEMQKFVGTVQETHGRLAEVIQGLIELIENLIGGIEVRK